MSEFKLVILKRKANPWDQVLLKTFKLHVADVSKW